MDENNERMRELCAVIAQTGCHYFSMQKAKHSAIVFAIIFNALAFRENMADSQPV